MGGFTIATNRMTCQKRSRLSNDLYLFEHAATDYYTSTKFYLASLQQIKTQTNNQIPQDVVLMNQFNPPPTPPR